jgi:hypothetical protein
MMRSCCFLILALVAAGCAHTYPPEIAGQRTNSQGEVTQKLLRVKRGVTHTVLAADGPRSYENITCRYYFQEGNDPQREFFIGNDRKNPFLGPFLAVSNSSLWITYSEKIVWADRSEAEHIVTPAPDWPNPDRPGSGKPYTSYHSDDIDVYIFDDKGFFRHRTFIALQKGEGKFLPEGQTYAAQYAVEDGNRIVAFKSPKGWKKYDVVNDTVTDAEPAREEH